MKFTASAIICSLLLLGASGRPVDDTSSVEGEFSALRIGRPSRPPTGKPSGGPSGAPSGGPSGAPSGGSTGPKINPGNGGTLGNVSTGFGKGSDGKITGVTSSNSKIEGVDLVINGISVALDITDLGITAAQLQQNGDLRSCIANTPACCREIQAGIADADTVFCKQAGVDKVLAGSVGGCATTGAADEAYLQQASVACAAAFPLGSST